MPKTQIGLIGLGPMGIGLAENLAEKGLEVFAWDKNAHTCKSVSSTEGQKINICANLEDLVNTLETPRCILICIPSGPPVDLVLVQLEVFLSEDDVVADCGNSYFRDTQRREDLFQKSGIVLLGVGVSGGPDGARVGPSLMVGGDCVGWGHARFAFELIAAKADGQPCCGYFGPRGSGHFVKMVHNGIEYGVMHLLMEVYAILKRVARLDHERISEIFQQLNSGPTEGFLTGVTARVAAARLPGQERYLIDMVDCKAGQKGTGCWAVQTAIDLGIPVPTIAEAVMSRQLSFVIDDENVQKDCISSSSKPMQSMQEDELEEIVQKAIVFAFISTFIQGLSLLIAANSVLGHKLDLRDVLSTWRRGSILQGALVDRLYESANELEALPELLRVAVIEQALDSGVEPLRQLVSWAVMGGVPCSGLASSLAYIESNRGSALPTGLIQLQRDYFGQHGLHDKETGEAIDAMWQGVIKRK
jgi:6-phosphogluconate dehydrogenase